MSGTVAALDIRDFLDSLIFNVLIGNADAHGKLFNRKTERRLAPFYDLVCIGLARTIKPRP